MAGRLSATKASRKGPTDDGDLDSIASFASGPKYSKPAVKYAWSGNAQVDADSYHKMAEEYRAAKEKQSADELKIKQLAAQLARTEEAAKRALVRSDQGAKGSTAQQLLEAQKQVQQLQAENSSLASKLARGTKRANEFKLAAEENRRRLEAALREQRALARKLGEAEKSLGGSGAARTAARKTAAEQAYWSEEAGRRFAAQQEELVSLREQNRQLQQQIAAATPADVAVRYDSRISELQQLVQFYEQQVMDQADAVAAVSSPVAAALGVQAQAGRLHQWRHGNMINSPAIVGFSTPGSKSAAAAGAVVGGTAAGSPSASQHQQQQPQQQQHHHADGPALGASQGSAGVVTLKEALLRERVAALEAELAEARSSIGAATDGFKQVEVLKAEVARYQARLAELENDFLSLDVVAKTEVGEIDAEMRKAWFMAAAFKKRYMEVKIELDAIKATAEKMQAALDDTHRALHAEAAKCMALEEAATMVKLEAARAKELSVALAVERAERLKHEKDYLELQSKAFAAPGGALTELHVLREELLAARRERAVSEAREAELRREVAAVKRQLEGVSPEEHRLLQCELAEAQRKLVSSELELRATLDKLEVYRRADDATAVAVQAAAAMGAAAAAAGGSGGHKDGGLPVGLDKSLKPDEGESEEELRNELSQLRQAMALEAGEINKLRKLLDTETAISLEAKAALEEAQSALAAAKADAAQQVAEIQRKLDNRDERIKKLEAQLRSAYGGQNRAVLRATTAETAATDKANGVSGSARLSRVGVQGKLGGNVNQSLDDVVPRLGPNENVIELVVADATLQASELSPDASTFMAWDFFLHDSQATPLARGPTPIYNTTVQYIVEADGFLLEYLLQQQLALELFEARGWDVVAMGVAHLPLHLLLQDLEVGAALGIGSAWHHVDIIGSQGQQLGRLRLGLRVAKPMDKLMLQYTTQQQQQQQAAGVSGSTGSPPTQLASAVPRQQQQQKQQQPQLDGRGIADGWGDSAAAALQVLQHAAQQADAEPQKASHLLVTIHRCKGLVQHQHQPHQQQQQQEVVSAAAGAGSVPAQRPYVHYTPPGRNISHDTCVGSGDAPVFNDAASWRILRSPAVEQAMRQQQLEVAIFDDAISDPATALLGLAAVPLTPLADGIPVEDVLDIINPIAGQPAGQLWINIAWHNPWETAAAGSKQLKPRVPMLDHGATEVMAEAAVGVGESSSLPAVQPQQQQHLQQLLQQQQQHWQSPVRGQDVAPLPYVPMLSPLRTHAANNSPSTSPAAAAAVAAALSQKQQEQQRPLFLQTGPLVDPMMAFMGSSRRAAADESACNLLLLHSQQAVSGGLGHRHRYGHGSALDQSYEALPAQMANGKYQGPLYDGNSPVPGPTDGSATHSSVAAGASALPLPPAMLPAAAAAAAGGLAGGTQQYRQTAGGARVGPNAVQHADSIMRAVNPASETWGSFDSTIYFKVENLSLSEDALADCTLQHVLLAHMFCEDFTSAAQQCTSTVPKGPGPLPFSYAVAYSIADPVTLMANPAGVILAQALAAADIGSTGRMVLPVLLASSKTQVVTDFSHVECIATCEVDLSDIWQGISGDVISREFSLLPAAERAVAYPSGCAGQLRLTLVAARALATLKQQP